MSDRRQSGEGRISADCGYCLDFNYENAVPIPKEFNQQGGHKTRVGHLGRRREDVSTQAAVRTTGLSGRCGERGTQGEDRAEGTRHLRGGEGEEGVREQSERPEQEPKGVSEGLLVPRQE